MTWHYTCADRECVAKQTLENGLQMEMGGGTYTYLTLPDQVRAGNISASYIDATVKTMLRTKFALGLFESKHGSALSMIRLTSSTRPVPIPGLRDHLTHLANQVIVASNGARVYRSSRKP